MNKLLLGLTAVFALSVASPALAEDKPAAEKPAKKAKAKAKAKAEDKKADEKPAK